MASKKKRFLFIGGVVLLIVIVYLLFSNALLEGVATKSTKKSFIKAPCPCFTRPSATLQWMRPETTVSMLSSF
jgi:hypothetical protein